VCVCVRVYVCVRAYVCMCVWCVCVCVCVCVYQHLFRPLIWLLLTCCSIDEARAALLARAPVLEGVELVQTRSYNPNAATHRFWVTDHLDDRAADAMPSFEFRRVTYVHATVRSCN
jgi:hypothetical protein